jgi:transcriptional regulator with XRE-family HTH domain
MDSERAASCGARIKRGLQIRGMKQADLCQITKIPKSAISQYISEAFEPKQDRIYLISKALNVSEAWLMGYDVPMERVNTSPLEEVKLSEGEKMWLDLYHRLSDESKEVLLNTMTAFDRIPEDKQQFVLQAIRFALGNQE